MKASAVAAVLRWLLAAALVALSWGARAQSLEVSTATELRASPALNAKSLAALPVGTRAEQLESQGGWVRIKAGAREGWVRGTHLRTAGGTKAAAASTANPVTGLTGLFSASSTRPTATTGTRGLTQEQLAKAQPAPAEVAQLESYAVTAAQAQQFAQGGNLAAQPIKAYTGAE
ncbi:MAG: SH3 domain-containing protein [Burkholderiaceae bacterium]|nr:MAG: SH3 domain-containing protein [Burkholderiaceae bacterium]